jgi:hypothetical protein
MTNMEILGFADKCGVTAIAKHEWDGKRFNHTDDLLDGDFSGLIQFARLLMAIEREACAKLCEDMWVPEEGVYHWIPDSRGALQNAAEAIRARGEK